MKLNWVVNQDFCSYRWLFLFVCFLPSTWPIYAKLIGADFFWYFKILFQNSSMFRPWFASWDCSKAVSAQHSDGPMTFPECIPPFAQLQIKWAPVPLRPWLGRSECRKWMDLLSVPSLVALSFEVPEYSLFHWIKGGKRSSTRFRKFKEKLQRFGFKDIRWYKKLLKRLFQRFHTYL